jgi:hypothetical protein
MTHDETVAEIQRRARARGILTHYCGTAVRCSGDRGQPDIVCVGKFGAAWIEVKSPYDRLSSEQTQWMHALRAAGQLHYVVRPQGLDDGSVDAILDRLAFGQSLLFGAA